MIGSPPGPLLQSLNAVLHREPIASLAYACFWCLFLVFWTPIAILALQVRALIHVVFWASGRKPGACDPVNPKQKYELGIVVTGCDSGFGKELALWAADAGYIVFAGCLEKKKSWEGLLPEGLIPLQMDVTNADQVASAVEVVQDWLKHECGDGKTRVLHSLINNAGVGSGGLVDWADLSAFQFCIDGKVLPKKACQLPASAYALSL